MHGGKTTNIQDTILYIVLKGYCGSSDRNWSKLESDSGVIQLQKRVNSKAVFSQEERKILVETMGVDKEVLFGKKDIFGHLMGLNQPCLPVFMIRGDATMGLRLKELMSLWPEDDKEPEEILVTVLDGEFHHPQQVRAMFNGASPLSYTGLLRVFDAFKKRKAKPLLQVEEFFLPNWKRPTLSFDEAPAAMPPPVKEEQVDLPNLDADKAIYDAIQSGALVVDDNRIFHKYLFSNLVKMMEQAQMNRKTLAERLAAQNKKQPGYYQVSLDTLFRVKSVTVDFLADILTATRFDLREMLANPESPAKPASGNNVEAPNAAAESQLQPVQAVTPSPEEQQEQAEETDLSPLPAPPEASAPADETSPAPLETIAETISTEAPLGVTVEEKAVESTDSPQPETVAQPAAPSNVVPADTSVNVPAKEIPVFSPTVQEKAALEAANRQIDKAVADGRLVLHTSNRGNTVEGVKLKAFWFKAVGKEVSHQVALMDIARKASSLVGLTPEQFSRTHWGFKDNDRLSLKTLSAAMVTMNWSLDDILGLAPEIAPPQPPELVVEAAPKPSKAKEVKKAVAQAQPVVKAPAIASATVATEGPNFHGLSTPESGALMLVMEGLAESESRESTSRALLECVPLPRDLTELLAFGLSQLTVNERRMRISRMLKVVEESPIAAQ